MLEARNSDLAQQFTDLMPAHLPLEARLELMATLLCELGFDAVIESDGEALYLVQRNCPNLTVARQVLGPRDRLQSQIDAWYEANPRRPVDLAAQRAFLTEIGYLQPDPGPVSVGRYFNVLSSTARQYASKSTSGTPA